MPAYLDQNAEITLADGLAEYYRAYPFLKRGDELNADARVFFHNHDVIHVLYGCGTSLTHEAIVKLSSLFGTTGGGVMRGYRLHESKDIYRTLRLGDMAVTIALAPFIVPRTLWRCLRQRKRWPWSDHEALLHTPLRTLRAAYGVRVAGAPGRPAQIPGAEARHVSS